MSSAFKIYALFIGSALLMFGGGLQGLLLSVRGADVPSWRRLLLEVSCRTA